MQQAKCPNLYWALTDLPSPLVDLRKGVQGEQTMVAAELRRIRDDGPMTESELEALVSRLSGVISFAREQSGQPPRSVRAASACRGQGRRNGPRRSPARWSRLAARREIGASFPPLQIILLDQKHRYEIERDERLKLLCVPVWQSRGSAPAGKPAGALPNGPWRSCCRTSESSAPRKPSWNGSVALLRYVEAVRLYAAAHDGKVGRQRGRHSRAAAARPGYRQAVRVFGRRDDGAYPRRVASGARARAPAAASTTA